MNSELYFVILVLAFIIGLFIFQYIMNRFEQVEDIEKTINGKKFKILRNRKWYEW